MDENTRIAIPARTMSVHDFVQWGIQDVAYIKSVLLSDGATGWGIFGADGNNIGIAPNRDVAFAAVRQHDLEPLSVH